MNGQEFYFHTVSKGNTLYGISKMYNVDVKDILRYNEEAKSGLRIDQVLQIPVKKANTRKVERNELRVDGSYLIHRVVKGETLYGISKRYNVPQELILKHNPELKEGIKPDMELKIETLSSVPQTPNEEDLKSLYEPAKLDSFINHTVKQKETWYGIASKYQVNIDTLMAFNSQFRKGIQIGDVLRIPRLSPQYVKKKEFGLDEIHSSSVLSKDSLKSTIYLFLPFYLEENDTSFISKVEDGLTFKNEINPKSLLAFEFYEGVLLALDSLKRKGLSLRLVVIDTKAPNFKTQLDSLPFSDVDLIIGPLYRSNFEEVLSRAKPYGIPMVSPVPQSNKILLGNPNVIKVAPSSASEVSFMRDYYDTELKGANFYLVNSYQFRDAPLLNVFLNEGEGAAAFDSTMLLTITNPEEARLDKYLDTLGNYFYLPSTDKSYVGRFVNLLYPYSRKYPITLIGMSDWSAFDHLDIDYLERLNLHFTTEFFVDYDDPDVIEFLRKYRARFGTEPKKYGFFGYEVCLNFADFNNSNLTQDIERINRSGSVLNFDFRKFDFSNGVENRGLYLIRVNDFRLERVK